MQVIPPLAIMNSMVTPGWLPEPGVGEQTWAVGTTYAAGAQVILGSPTSTVTIAIASPVVITWAAHGLPDGTPVVFTTTGALPTGLTVGIPYYSLGVDANSFQLTETAGGALISVSGSQSGTHTAVAQLHRTYQSLQASNVGNPPAIAASAAWWLDVGPTNAWAMFDLLRNTASSAAGSITVTITPGQRVGAIALLGLIADEVQITATSSGVQVYSQTHDLSTRETVDWYGYFFNPFTTSSATIDTDLPPYSNLVVSVTVTRLTGYVSVGSLVIGTPVYLGVCQYNAVSDAVNFSTVDRDTYGNTTLIPRRSVPKTNQTTRIAKTNVPSLLVARDALNAAPAVWSGIDDDTSGYFEALLILGIYNTFTITLDQPEDATVTLELEEV